MLPVLGRVSDRVRRDLFVEAVAGRARVSPDLVHAELGKLAPQKALAAPRRQLQGFGQVTKAEKGLIWWLLHEPAPALAVLGALDEADIEGLSSSSVLDLARKLNDDRGFSPSVLLERLSMVEAQFVTAIASESEAHVNPADECARILRRLRFERERTAVQQEIDRLQRLGQGHEGDDQLEQLLVRKYDLIQRIDALM
jgi:hypothetical protein